MPTHAEQRVLPYTPEQLFALVADVERYPEFLPWCVGARIRERQPDLIIADLIIGFRVFRERFTSRVALTPPRRIDVTYTEGPFRYLNNHWIFDPAPGISTAPRRPGRPARQFEIRLRLGLFRADIAQMAVATLDTHELVKDLK